MKTIIFITVFNLDITPIKSMALLSNLFCEDYADFAIRFAYILNRQKVFRKYALSKTCHQLSVSFDWQ